MTRMLDADPNDLGGPEYEDDDDGSEQVARWRERAEKAEARVAELEKERDDLRATLGLYRYEDCPECYARAEMLADVEEHPGMAVVRPTGYKITHEESCTVGRMMPRESDSVSDTKETKDGTE